MSSLLQRHDLLCPYQRARDFLDSSLRGLAESGASQTIRLNVAIGSDDSIDIAKDVIAHFGVATDPLHFDQPWSIRWSPSSGYYPDFEGTLTVRADEDYTTSVLELQGAYRPPLGAAGAAFDALLGSRIASATAREFLQRLAREIEQRYRDEEAQKPDAHGG